MITTVFFDLDDTLLDFHAAEAEALSETLRRLGLPVTEEILSRYSAINAAQWRRLETGELSRREVLLTRFTLLFSEYGFDRRAEDAQAQYEVLLSAGHKLLDGAEQLLQTLSASYRLCAASNGTASIQHRRLRESGIESYFDRIFISEEIGADKPSAAFFDRCFAALGNVRRAECVMIGDSLTSDIRGGINAGMHTVWYNPHGKAVSDIVPDHIVGTLDEIPDVIFQMK